MPQYNEKGEQITVNYPDFSEATAAIYINPGPFFDNLDEKKIFDNILDEIISLEVHSSIDSFYRYGSVVIPDRIGFRETLSLTGNEIITVRYANSVTSSDVPPKTIHFNIYDMEEVSLSNEYKEKFTNKAIKLHLIEAPFFLLYNKNIWSKSYGIDYGDGTFEKIKLNQIFNSHLRDDLKITDNNIVILDLKEMSTEMNWYIPSWKSQKAFSYLLQFARDDKDNGNVKFFTTTDVQTNNIVINLKSINQMFNVKSGTTYSVVNVGPMSQSAGVGGQTAPKTIDHLIDFKFVSYDIVSLASGLPGGRLYNRDYVTGQYFDHVDNYISTNQGEKYFGQYGLWSDTISNWKNMDYQIGSWPRELAVAYLNNKIINQKYQLRCIAETYLNHNRSCGNKAFMLFPATSSSLDTEKSIDEQMSGEWIINEMTDYITNGRGFTHISFIKDSFFNTTSTTQGSNKEKLPSVTPVNKRTQSNIQTVQET